MIEPTEAQLQAGDEEYRRLLNDKMPTRDRVLRVVRAALNVEMLKPVVVDGEGWLESAFDGYQPYEYVQCGFAGKQYVPPYVAGGLSYAPYSGSK